MVSVFGSNTFVSIVDCFVWGGPLSIRCSPRSARILQNLRKSQILQESGVLHRLDSRKQLEQSTVQTYAAFERVGLDLRLHGANPTMSLFTNGLGDRHVLQRVVHSFDGLVSVDCDAFDASSLPDYL